MKREKCQFYEEYKGRTIWMLTPRIRQELTDIIKAAYVESNKPEYVNKMNKHDNEIIVGLFKKIAPFDEGGDNEDPSQDQIKKFNICLDKLDCHGVSFKKEGSKLTPYAMRVRMDAWRAEKKAYDSRTAFDTLFETNVYDINGNLINE